MECLILNPNSEHNLLPLVFNSLSSLNKTVIELFTVKMKNKKTKPTKFYTHTQRSEESSRKWRHIFWRSAGQVSRW